MLKILPEITAKRKCMFDSVFLLKMHVFSESVLC